ncbi:MULTISPECIES: hypothetical protein [unclassified Saccharothrix]|uniref:hypothetical protein n=1 Tax=unclassified Saccharothrix TaxID=2593673 RepID=UPI00307D975C
MALSDNTSSVVIVDRDDLDAVTGIAAEHGVLVQPVDTRDLEPVLTVTLVLLGSALAVGTVTHLVDRVKGGQVVDLRPGAPRPLYRSKDVVYGLIVIHTVDGKVSVEVKEPRGLFGQAIDAVVQVLTGMPEAGAAEVAGVVESAVGEIGSVAVERASGGGPV